MFYIKILSQRKSLIIKFKEKMLKYLNDKEWTSYKFKCFTKRDKNKRHINIKS